MVIVTGSAKISKKIKVAVLKKTHVALIKGRTLKYRVRRHPRARNRRVTISPEQGVVVTIPSKGSLAGIDDLFRKWEDWLEEKIENDAVWNGPVIRQFATGSTVLFKGVLHRIEISVLPAGRSRGRVTAEDGVLKMELPPDEVMQPLPALIKFFKKEAKAVFQERVAVWSEITGLVPSRVIVGERTSRWGSCSFQGTLSFCYRLILAPPEILDAIVVHELCHLKHRNHGKIFWALVKRYNPDYENVRKWLNTHAKELKL